MTGIGFERTGDHVVTATLDRPPHNYFQPNTIAELNAGIEAAAADGARAVVLRSTGRSFCAGADFSEGGLGGGDADIRRVFYKEALRLYRSPLPLVAAVHGAAVGGGVGLALACDVRVACPDAYFAVNFVRLGISPGFAITESLPRVVGSATATELMLTGRRVYGEEAASLGLIHRCVRREQLASVALEFAEEIAGSAPLAVAEVRRMLHGRSAASLDRALEEETAAQARLRKTADFDEGVDAMLGRRSPRFQGR